MKVMRDNSSSIKQDLLAANLKPASHVPLLFLPKMINANGTN